MATAIRFMLTVPEDVAQRAEVLKRGLYSDKPYAEMYRQLIQIGMNVITKAEESCQSQENHPT